MEEIWKDIKGYEGFYQVSNMGNIKSLEHYRKNGMGKYLQKGKVIDQRFKHNRYGRVTLYKYGKGKDISVHRLVAMAFIPNPNNKPQVNHIDNNSSNNSVDNLEWVTAQENVKHAYKIGASIPPMLGKNHTQTSKDLIRKNKIGTKAYNRAFNYIQAVEIIKRKICGEKRKNVYLDFMGLITQNGFENIWYGRSYKEIWKEII